MIRVLFISLCAATCWLAPARAQVEDLNLIIFAGGLSWPIFVAQDKGIFEKHHLNVHITETPGSVFQVRGLMDDKFDIAMTPFDNVVAYDEGQGEVALDGQPDLFAFMGGISSALRLLVAPDITSFAALRGKKMGIDASTTGFTLLMFKLLDANGVPPDSYAMERIGGTTFRVKALLNGQVAGTVVSSPQEIVPETKGFRRLGDVQSMIGSYQSLSGAARRVWAAKNGDKLVAYIKAYVEANEWLADPAHREEAVAIYLRHIPGTPLNVAEQAWDVMLNHGEGFEPKAKFDAKGAATVLAIRNQYGVPKKDIGDWQKYVDESYYRKALNIP